MLRLRVRDRRAVRRRPALQAHGGGLRELANIPLQGAVPGKPEFRLLAGSCPNIGGSMPGRFHPRLFVLPERFRYRGSCGRDDRHGFVSLG
jgi:hypothetical protein